MCILYRNMWGYEVVYFNIFYYVFVVLDYCCFFVCVVFFRKVRVCGGVYVVDVGWCVLVFVVEEEFIDGVVCDGVDGSGVEVCGVGGGVGGERVEEGDKVCVILVVWGEGCGVWVEII